MAGYAIGVFYRSWEGVRYEWSPWKMAKRCITLSLTGTSSYHKNIMKLHYYPETDSLYIDLNSKQSSDSHEIADGLVLDFHAEGNVAGIDIDHASRKLYLKILETAALPVHGTTIA